LDEENFILQTETKRKKPWGGWLKGLAKWLIILKLLAALISEVYQIIS
jgi:hypothetical protein